jgi:SAM-dependent methyltransferase
VESASQSSISLEHPEGRVCIEELGGGRRRIRVEDATTFISGSPWDTAYPVDLVSRILAVKGASYLCDEIRREEEPNYVPLFLRYSLLGFVPEEEFEGARILDFGSGSGASTATISRMFPSAHVVGVELVPEFNEIARARAEHYGLDNVEFLESPDPGRLPGDIGTFDFVNLGAVYEHLLPAERQRLLTQLWSLLRVGGVLFVNQLPHRYYVVEAHTTGLPLINFLPDRAAHLAARRFSERIDRGATWPELLRAGIRGGTERSIVRAIRGGGGDPLLLRPTRLGLKSHTDLWYAYSVRVRAHPVKRAMRTAFRTISRIGGTSYAPSLSVALRKRG